MNWRTYRHSIGYTGMKSAITRLLIRPMAWVIVRVLVSHRGLGNLNGQMGRTSTNWARLGMTQRRPAMRARCSVRHYMNRREFAGRRSRHCCS